MSEKITALVVDDHWVVRQGVISFLRLHSHIEVVGEAESGEKAVELCERFAPDVVVVDLLMAGMNGVETTRRIKEVSPRSQVIVLTSHHDNEYVLPAIEAGALSYLLKDVSPVELVVAVEKAAAGEAVLHPRIASHIVGGLRAAAKRPKDKADDLTNREREILELIAQGMSNMEIGERLFISEKTVKSHVGNILGKLRLTDRTQIAVYAWRNRLVK
jgi:two-component system, NarL family, response regulator LiaR